MISFEEFKNIVIKYPDLEPEIRINFSDKKSFEHLLSVINDEYSIDLDEREAGGRYDSDIDIDLKIINKILPLAEELQEAASELDKGGSAC